MEGAYTFVDVDRCNMCGRPASDAKILGRRQNSHQGLRPVRRRGITTTIRRCAGCGLIFTDPLPVPGHVGQHYDLPPEEYWTADYLDEGDQGVENYAIPTFHRLWDGQGRTPVALDVGAGLGHAMRALQAAGFETWGIEPSATFRDRAIERDIDENRLVHAAAEAAEFPEAQFDFINMAAVVEHLVDPAAVLARAVSWLAPGGLIWVAVPSADWLLARMLNLVYRLQGLDFVTNTSPMHPPFHLYEFTRGSFQVLGQRLGFDVVDSRVVVCETFLPRPLDRMIRRVMGATGTGMILEVWLQRPGMGEPATEQLSESLSQSH